MDVTSLLNSSSLGKGEAAMSADARSMVDHVINSTSARTGGPAGCSSGSGTSSHEKTPPRTTSDTKVPSRSRTPWDANGYALPLTLDTKSTQVSARPVSNSASPAGSSSPKSPRHKFSDSHSSLSSYASSSASLSHSRISSMSTVGGVPPISAIPDTPSLDTQFECVELTMPKIWSLNIQQKPTKEIMISPPAINRVNERPMVADAVRSSSPSDAMLMTRGAQGLDRTSRQEPDVIITKDIRPDISHLVPLDFAKAHKRAISAPDFTAVDPIHRSFPPLPAAFQPTPSPSHRSELRSNYIMDTASPPEALSGQHVQDDEGVFCMYKPNCDTGSQLRKAISHIFGRNKKCTRKIPPPVWVYFCRKHYQRSRYRNAHEWARVQCDLVQRQLRRVQEWSDENKRTGYYLVVRDWSLSMRKREQNRVQEKSNRKRSYRDESDDEDDDDAPDSATMNGTAVPDWLRDKCGDGYSTAEIEEIVARLKQEMEETNMTQIPDIEILANLPPDPEEARPKAMLRRKTSSGSHTHKRSQSVGVTLRPEPQPMTRRVSQPAYWRQEDAMRPSPIEKRQRVSDPSPFRDRHSHMSSRLPERPPMAPLRPMHSLPHRPAFNNIEESRAEDSYYDGEGPRVPNYGYNHWPAPISHQNGGQSAAVTSEPSTARDYLDSRRTSHQRSFSEVDSYQHGFTFRSPLGYPSMPPSHLPESASYERGSMPSSHSHTASANPSYYDDRLAPAQQSFGSYQSSWSSPVTDHAPPYPGYRHIRHQSTPSTAHASIPQIPAIEYGHANSTRPVAYEQSPTYHRRQHSYAPSRQYPNRPLVEESDQTKAVFSERR
ncbi:hypothetical protein F4677DRAFT_200032 [Hypoxylon crocopeplum]|nr:hypothetical protein F4677DRAFT_200032 [Hypoxylon crocopeplum]